MTHASLFSGKGGFDLAAYWAGWTNVFNCEIDPFCRQILKYWFPDSIQYNNVNDTSQFEQHADKIDVLSAGFPCQPFSTAGSRQGTDDPRYMWPQTFRGIRAIRPAVFIGENVSGLISWSKGMVFEQVCADLESEGFTVIPLLLPACGVGAPHKRERIWFIAINEQRLTADSNSNIRCKRGMHEDRPKASERYISLCNSWDFRNSWQNFPTQSPVRRKYDGLSDLLDPDAIFAGVKGKRRGSAYVRWCNESIKSDGNAIVPQVALQIFETINELTKKYQDDK